MFAVSREMNQIANELRLSYKTALKSSRGYDRNSMSNDQVKVSHRQLCIIVPMVRAMANFEQNATLEKRLEWAKTYESLHAKLEREIRRNAPYALTGDPSVLYPMLSSYPFPVIMGMGTGFLQVVNGKTLVEIFDDEVKQLRGKKKEAQFLTKKLISSLTDEQKKTIRELAKINNDLSVSISCRSLG